MMTSTTARIPNRFRRSVAALALAAGAAVALAGAAQAHTPQITPTCDGLAVTLTSYEQGDVKVWIDGAKVTDIAFGKSFKQEYVSDGDGFTYRVKIDDRGTQYDRDTGVVVVKGCPVPTSTVTVTPPPVTTTVTAPPVTVTETQPPVTTTETLPPVTTTETVPGPTSTTTSTGPAVTVTENVPGPTSTSVLTGPPSTITNTIAGPTATEVIRSAGKELAYTGSDFRSPITWVVLLLLAAVTAYSIRFGLRRNGAHR